MKVIRNHCITSAETWSDIQRYISTEGSSHQSGGLKFAPRSWITNPNEPIEDKKRVFSGWDMYFIVFDRFEHITFALYHCLLSFVSRLRKMKVLAVFLKFVYRWTIMLSNASDEQLFISRLPLNQKERCYLTVMPRTLPNTTTCCCHWSTDTERQTNQWLETVIILVHLGIQQMSAIGSFVPTKWKAIWYLLDLIKRIFVLNSKRNDSRHFENIDRVDKIVVLCRRQYPLVYTFSER